MADADFINAVRATSARLGINPSDLLTAISYETGGKMSPSLWGGKNNNHLGLIQFGANERAKYGVNPQQSAVEQMGAVEGFLRDRGVKPGMGLLDIYSTINAGRPGLYNRSDAHNGGAPGTVADKVAGQMWGHRKRAEALLGGAGGAPMVAAAPVASAPVAAPTMAPGSMAEAGDGSDPLLAALKAIPLAVEPEEQVAPAPMNIRTVMPRGLQRARDYARAMAARPVMGVTG